MGKETSTGEAIYNFIELLIEVAIDDYVRNGKWLDEKIGKYIEENRKEQLQKALK